jgi:hypothetical protein
MKLIDPKKPIHPQVIELAKYLEMPEDTIDEIKKQLEQRDVKVTMGIIKHLSTLFIGKSILDGVDEDKIKID